MAEVVGGLLGEAEDFCGVVHEPCEDEASAPFGGAPGFVVVGDGGEAGFIGGWDGVGVGVVGVGVDDVDALSAEPAGEERGAGGVPYFAGGDGQEGEGEGVGADFGGEGAFFAEADEVGEDAALAEGEGAGEGEVFGSADGEAHEDGGDAEGGGGVGAGRAGHVRVFGEGQGLPGGLGWL